MDILPPICLGSRLGDLRAAGQTHARADAVLRRHVEIRRMEKAEESRRSSRLLWAAAEGPRADGPAGTRLAVL